MWPDEPGWHIVVGAEGEGERLDQLIARRVPRLSRSRAARLEVIALDELDTPTGHSLKKSLRMRAGQRIWVRRPHPPEDVSSLADPRVIRRDPDLLALEKPSGWVAHPTASRYLSALTTWLSRQELSHQGFNVTPAHRLDLETSGVVLCACTAEAEVTLRRLFADRSVNKRYLAVCEVSERGRYHLEKWGERWREDTPLGFDTQSAVRLKIGVGELEAQTEFRVVEHSRSGGRALIEARPLTGRQHQIRAHLALVGLPIVGDKLYGPSELIFLKHLEGTLDAQDWILLGHTRHALHASEISLSWSGRSRVWSSPLPAELYALLSL